MERATLGHDIDYIKTLERIDDCQGDHHHRSRAEQWDNHPAQGLPVIGAIDLSRFNQFLGDGGQPREEYDHCQPDLLPTPGHDHRKQGRVWIRQPGICQEVQMQEIESQVEQTQVGVVDPDPDLANHRQRQADRQVKQGLEKICAPNFSLQDQGDRQTDAGGHHDRSQHPYGGIFDSIQESWVGGYLQIVIEAHPVEFWVKAVPICEAVIKG